MRSVLPLCLGGLLTLTGCATQPTSPTAPAQGLAPEPWSATDGLTRATPLPAHWWRLYQDPLLDALVARTLEHNPDLASAEAHVQGLLGSLRAASGERLPDARLGYAYRYGRDGDDQTLAQARGESVEDTGKHALSLDLSYELDFWGRVAASIRAARDEAEAARAARDGLRTTLVAQTARAYASACALGEQEAVTRRAVALVQQGLVLTERQVAAGALDELDRARQQALLENTAAPLSAIQARRRVALLALQQLSGEAPGPVAAELANCSRVPQLAKALPVGDGWALLQRRADVREAERRLAASGERVQVAHADLYPQVRLGLGIESAAVTPSGLGDGEALTYAVGPLISWRWPNQEQARGQLQRAQAGEAEAQAHFHSVSLAALHEVERDLALYAGSYGQRQRLAAAERAAQQAWHLAQVSYDAGAVDGFERLDSERSLVGAQQRLAEADLELVQRQVAVFQALGGGWQDENETAPTARTGER
ncbi:MAG: Outer membrane protein OprM [Stenotrophomonas maltophilia]|nr:MAG: Outer membrane protein OprM [Stenotrophomonas maltophilia]